MYYLVYMLMGVGISQVLLFTQRVLAKYQDMGTNSMLFVLPPAVTDIWCYMFWMFDHLLHCFVLFITVRTHVLDKKV